MTTYTFTTLDPLYLGGTPIGINAVPFHFAKVPPLSGSPSGAEIRPSYLRGFAQQRDHK